MSNEDRRDLVKFCVLATADINGVDIVDVDPDKFLNMSDEELKKEADWLDDLLSK